MKQIVDKIGKGFFLVHTIWALLGVGLSALLLIGDGGGHPPAIFFVGVVVVIWFIGHLMLAGAGMLTKAGRRSAHKDSDETNRQAARKAGGEADWWPIVLIFIVIACGLIASFGLLQLAGSALIGGWYPLGKGLWGLSLAVALAHGICLVALLLRRAWSRWASALLCVGWAAVMVWQVREQVVHGHRIEPADYVYAFTGIVLPLFLAWRVLFSRQVRAFLDR